MNGHPRHHPHIWNQFKTAQTNARHVSEGQHNQFHLLVGKNHSDTFKLITELQQEQADTETAIQEFNLGRTVKTASKKKWKLF